MNPVEAFIEISKKSDYKEAIILGVLIIIFGYSSEPVQGIYILLPVVWIITAAILSATGRWLGGKGNYKKMFIALMYSGIPYFLIFTLMALRYLVEPFGIFDYTLGALIFIAYVWEASLTLIAVREVHQFSNFKTILTFLWPFGIIAKFFLKKK